MNTSNSESMLNIRSIFNKLLPPRSQVFAGDGSNTLIQRNESVTYDQDCNHKPLPCANDSLPMDMKHGNRFELKSQSIEGAATVPVDYDFESSLAAQILIIDDHEQRCTRTSEMLRHCGWLNLHVTKDVSEGVKRLEKLHTDLIVCSIDKLDQSAIETFQEIARKNSDVALLLITELENKTVADKVVLLGAQGYLTHPFTPDALSNNVFLALKGKQAEKKASQQKDAMNRVFQRKNVVLKRAVDELYETMEGIVSAIAKTVEARDPYTAGHQDRVSHLSVLIAEKLGWDSKRIKGLSIAAQVHDIGKISIPAEILSKPGEILFHEFEFIKSHCLVGYDILRSLRLQWPIADMVYQHHEKIDGSGYPNGLHGHEILDEAKIICVADVIEAMASHRPYRAALGIDTAIDEIQSNKGVHYDADIVDACLEVIVKDYDKRIFMN